MTDNYNIINQADADRYPKAQLLEMYNQAVETIWNLQRLNKDLNEEIDRWQEAYEEVSNQLYG